MGLLKLRSYHAGLGAFIVRANTCQRAAMEEALVLARLDCDLIGGVTPPTSTEVAFILSGIHVTVRSDSDLEALLWEWSLAVRADPRTKPRIGPCSVPRPSVSETPNMSDDPVPETHTPAEVAWARFRRLFGMSR